jgi:hypothetical protein
MKRLMLTGLCTGALFTAQAGGFYVSAAFPVYPSSYVYSYPAYSGYYTPYSYPYYPASGYEYVRPNYAVNGTLLGAFTGGLIGAANCRGWEGAGIGAAAGLVLGGITEAVVAKHEQRGAYMAPPVPPPRAFAPAPPRVTAQPKSLYQIPDAPRVPDAPTF